MFQDIKFHISHFIFKTIRLRTCRMPLLVACPQSGGRLGNTAAVCLGVRLYCLQQVNSAETAETAVALLGGDQMLHRTACVIVRAVRPHVMSSDGGDSDRIFTCDVPHSCRAYISRVALQGTRERRDRRGPQPWQLASLCAGGQRLSCMQMHTHWSRSSQRHLKDPTLTDVLGHADLILPTGCSFQLDDLSAPHATAHLDHLPLSRTARVGGAVGQWPRWNQQPEQHARR